VTEDLAERSSTLVLLGATGDLAGRFLLPALARLLAAGDLPDDLRVVAAAPQYGDDTTFRSHAEARLAAHATGVPLGVQQALLERLTYLRLDLADPVGVAEALRSAGDDRTLVVYLALPSDLFSPALRALRAAGLPPGSRIAVEKPFGDDLAGAVALNAELAEVTRGGGGGYRVDHVLGMPAARSLLELRAPGAELAPLWDGDHLEQVDLLWEETLGLEGRADFFDRTGAVRDVVQNHVLQLLALVAMELPTGEDGRDLHAGTLALLRSVPPLSAQQVSSSTRRGRYTAGRLVGTATPVVDYADEEGVDPTRDTETYAEIVLEVDTPRWRGTRFVLRAGKALAARRKGVQLHPRQGVQLSGSGGGPLWIELDEPGAAGPGADVSGELLAYTAVLEDVLSGGSALSVSAQAAEQAWRIVEPVLQTWAAGIVPLLDYPAGSSGPPPLQGTVRR
jgi:glucose-6-phosphate 1-dehydrogenase